jgi:hypothetical protein
MPLMRRRSWAGWWGETTGQDGGIDTPLSFEEYAASLSGGRTWWFWWD